MKITTTKNDITFHHWMYDVVIPNNVNIEYYFNALLSEIIGIPLLLLIKSRSKKIVSKFWIFGNILYYFTFVFNRYGRYFIIWPPVIFRSTATLVVGENNINNFLFELKFFSYFKIDEQITSFNEIVNQKKLKTLIPGTKEHKKDKFLLFAIVFLIIFIPSVIGIAMSKNLTSVDYVQFTILFLCILLFCIIGYKSFTKIKKK